MAEVKLSPLKKFALIGSISLALVVWLVVALLLTGKSPMARFLLGAVAAGGIGVILVIVSMFAGVAGAVRATVRGDQSPDHD